MASEASLTTRVAPTANSIQRDAAQSSVTSHTRADVLHIGYPKAASTFLVRFLESHPQITVDQFQLSDLLQPITGTLAVREKPYPDKIHVSKDENVAESVCVVGELKNWQRYLYEPGAWDRVKNDVVVDPAEVALRLHKVHPDAKVLIVIREQTDWMQSVYKFVMSQLPWNHRSFADYCTTPSGIILLQAGHFDQTIRAYIDVFGSNRVHVLRFEDMVGAPRRFTAELFGFLGVSDRPIPQRPENETHAQIARIQRFFPFIEQLPRGVKNALKPHAMRLIPGARGSILSSRDVRMLRSIYAASNQRTERLIRQLST
jgi:Sulfotransferase family